MSQDEPTVLCNLEDDSRADIKLYLEEFSFGSISFRTTGELLAIATTGQAGKGIEKIQVFGWQRGTPIAIDVTQTDRNDFYRACANEVMRICAAQKVQDDIAAVVKPEKQPREYSLRDGWL